MKLKPLIWLAFFSLLVISCSTRNSKNPRIVQNFDYNWKFELADSTLDASTPDFDDESWRSLNLPHDWSIEGSFSKDNPAGVGGGALPGGIGWYRKTFKIPASDQDKLIFIDFDGVYQHSKVWINGHFLGFRPYGYSSFRYELTPYLHHGDTANVVAVRVDNSKQPNSRWYSGSGIYRNVWLVTTNPVYVDHWGTYVTTPEVKDAEATVKLETSVNNRTNASQSANVTTEIINEAGKTVASATSDISLPEGKVTTLSQEMKVNNPELWSVDSPHLYKVKTVIKTDGKITDEYDTPLGIRYFTFDRDKGFFLNGKSIKIKGVCNHHDLGPLGAAINKRAIERQLEMLKEMGCNGIRTSHNPPAPELLQLCDKMGFIVMDEAFDMWKKGKTKYDYHLYWDDWHKRDLEDLILRDRNHPSVFIWSIGNEILEQWDSTGTTIADELAGIVNSLDTTRPVTSACNDPQPYNSIIRSGALDLIGYNYHQEAYPEFPETFPDGKFIATETTSALATRGHYDMPADSIRRWPERWDKPFTDGNPDYTCSSYDNCSAPWGSTHEETWRIIKKYDFLSGMFIWTGFDYLGEPTPYGWPAKSSYFGIIDLAGFPKDAYYFYQSEWTNKPVLHLLPHWNWNEGQSIDVWAYTNYPKVELYLNGKSLGVKEKGHDDLHLAWSVPWEKGVLKAVAVKSGMDTLTEEIRTAGEPADIVLSADRQQISADGRDLSFVTVTITDENGTMVPHADNMVNFSVEGNGKIVGVGNGSEISHEPFQAEFRKAFNGKCLVIIQSMDNPGPITLKATSDGLKTASIQIDAQE